MAGEDKAFCKFTRTACSPGVQDGAWTKTDGAPAAAPGITSTAPTDAKERDLPTLAVKETDRLFAGPCPRSAYDTGTAAPRPVEIISC